MITGKVQSDEARIRLVVVGADGRTKEKEAVVDTGYSGSLTLPSATIQALGLPWMSTDEAELADGSICNFEVYAGHVIWDDKARSILVDQADADSLVGMRLIRGYELKMQVRRGGKVIIKRLA